MERSDKSKETIEQRIVRTRTLALMEMRQVNLQASPEENEQLLDAFMEEIENGYKTLTPKFGIDTEQYEVGHQAYMNQLVSFGIKESTAKQLMHLAALKVAN